MKAALSRGSAVFCFLYEDGVLLADRTRDVPQGEDDPSRQLAELTRARILRGRCLYHGGGTSRSS